MLEGERPLEQGRVSGLRLTAFTLQLDQLHGHELGPREQYPLGVFSLVVVAVSQHQFDRWADACGVAVSVAIAVDPVSSTGEFSMASLPDVKAGR